MRAAGTQPGCRHENPLTPAPDTPNVPFAANSGGDYQREER
jgi:hypothetical protein